MPLKQTDPRWNRIRLGKSSTTIGTAGCLLTCYSMLVGTTPDKLNEVYTKNGVFNGALIVQERAISLSKLRFNPDRYHAVYTPIIAETDHYKRQGIPQHFFIWLGDGWILDPVDGQKKLNKYRIVSYRNITPSEAEKEYMTEEQVKTMLFQVMQNGWRALHDYGSPSDQSIRGESDDIVNRYKSFFDNFTPGGDWCADQKFHQWHDEMVHNHPEYKK